MCLCVHTSIAFKIKDAISANIIENQIPLIPNRRGINKTVAVWNSNVLQVEEMIEMSPLFRDVKNEDVKTFNPYIKKEKAYIRIALAVRLTKLTS